MAFMPEDVLNKNFTATQFRRGYDEHEVDDFLDEIVVELRRLSTDNDELRTQLRTCQEDKGVIPPEAQGKIAAARAAAEQAEQESAARIAKATADAEEAEARAAERAKTATQASDEIARSAPAAIPARTAIPAPIKDQAAAEVGGTDAGVGAAAGVLALAQRLHEEYVSEGQATRERLIMEGQAHHDEVVGEATTKHDELLSTGQAKHDELIAEATARHEQMITEARESSTGMVAEAQQKRAEVLESLGRDRTLVQKKIDELRIFERDYRARLKTHLEDQLLVLEQAGGDETSDGEGVGKQQDGQRQAG